MTDTVNEEDDALTEWCGDCYNDPLKFVLKGYPWQEPGPLEAYDGPDTLAHALYRQPEFKTLPRRGMGHRPHGS